MCKCMRVFYTIVVYHISYTSTHNCRRYAMRCFYYISFLFLQDVFNALSLSVPSPAVMMPVSDEISRLHADPLAIYNIYYTRSARPFKMFATCVPVCVIINICAGRHKSITPRHTLDHRMCVYRAVYLYLLCVRLLSGQMCQL